ncbi:MAG: phosphotransferase, partial [Candidatus Diapherotrites archaeon]|nr:phosphotransferase [Candidatus Diapherotrites archaeon]
MAVWIKFTHAELDEILSNYRLGKLKSFKGFEEGVVHTNIKLNTTKGSYVVRILSPSTPRSKKAIEYEIRFLHKLDLHRIPIPGPVKRKDGSYLSTCKSGYCVVYDFIPGHHVKKVKKCHVQQIGYYLGRIHRVTRGYKP